MRRLANYFGLFREYGHSRFLYWLALVDYVGTFYSSGYFIGIRIDFIDLFWAGGVVLTPPAYFAPIVEIPILLSAACE
jgi:hypothetical protein